MELHQTGAATLLCHKLAYNMFDNYFTTDDITEVTCISSSSLVHASCVLFSESHAVHMAHCSVTWCRHLSCKWWNVLNCYCDCVSILIAICTVVVSYSHIWRIINLSLSLQDEAELVSMVSSSGVESDHPGSDVCEDDDVFMDALRYWLSTTKYSITIGHNQLKLTLPKIHRTCLN